MNSKETHVKYTSEREDVPILADPLLVRCGLPERSLLPRVAEDRMGTADMRDGANPRRRGEEDIDFVYHEQGTSGQADRGETRHDEETGCGVKVGWTVLW